MLHNIEDEEDNRSELEKNMETMESQVQGGVRRGIPDNFTLDADDYKIDSKLANYIYEFLNEKSNQIPTPEFVADVKAKASGEKAIIDSATSVIISRGFGIIVTSDMDIYISKLDNPEQFVITAEEYFRKNGNQKLAILTNKDNEDGYDLGRVMALQNVLSQAKELAPNAKTM